MNTESLKTEIAQIRARHSCPMEACREIFAFIQLVIRQANGQPVSGEFKRALREELDAAYRGLEGALASQA